MVQIQIKGNHASLANQIKIEKSVNYIKREGFDSAIKILKGFEKLEAKVRVIAETNTSFLYFLESILNPAKDYADIVVKTSRYNENALVNRGNCFIIKSNFKISK